MIQESDLSNPDDVPSGRRVTIAVVIPVFNQAHFLASAIESVSIQTRPADEIIVVDDGSTDDPAAVVSQFQNVKLVRQENRGLSGARNTGLRNLKSDYVVFLDSDDRLLPKALEMGLICMTAQPNCAFVYGGHRLTSGDGRRISPDSFHRIEGDAHLALLSRGNKIVSIASVLFRCDLIRAEGGFDERLRRCEDYDLFLRLAYRHPIAGYPTIVTEYVRHGSNMSEDLSAQLRVVLEVLDRHQARIAMDSSTRKALSDGRVHAYNYYVTSMLGAAFARWKGRRDTRLLLKELLEAARWSPRSVVRSSLGLLARRASRKFPSLVGPGLRRLRKWPDWIPVGSVQFGDLMRLSPISSTYGFDRGLPIDRYYIDKFLTANAAAIRGRVLEVGENSYTLRYGGGRVDQSDVLYIDWSNPLATIVGDLAQSDTLPKEAFDCIVLTQTIQFIFDVQAALRTVHDSLKPGGVLLLTTSGVSKMQDAWPWYWNFAPAGVGRLLQDQFGDGAISLETFGNVFAATAFLHGVAANEVDCSHLDFSDPDYSVIIAARAVKRIAA